MNIDIERPKLFNEPGVVIIVLFAMVAAIILGWLYFKPAPEKAGAVVVATVASEVKHIPQVEVPITSGKVTVYQGGAPVKRKLDLPAVVVDDDKQSVIASSKIPSDQHSHTVTTVLNTETGKSETFVRTDPLPWVAYEDRGEFGVYYGIKNGQRTGRIQARQDLIQVKALHVGVIGSVDVANSKPDYFVGVGIAYKW